MARRIIANRRWGDVNTCTPLWEINLLIAVIRLCYVDLTDKRYAKEARELINAFKNKVLIDKGIGKIFYY